MEPDVELLLDFMNTLDVENDTDVLRTVQGWQDWAGTRRLRAGTLTEARELRAALRAAVGDPDAAPVNVGAEVRIALEDGRPSLAASDVRGAVLAAAARLAILDEWPRMKICPADDCRWAFFDRSRNRSRTWCSMRVCGNREKARSWRARAAGS
ncbi:MAG: hypothetical protein GEU98_18465 [Pseudonocardiaceae bacterium]|nr:hypothetical protein [Pseudonocardiaceae bacterium]